MRVACTLSCHPEDDHHDVHRHPAAADGDHPNQGHLQEVQGQLGGESSSQVQATICIGGAVTLLYHLTMTLSQWKSSVEI